MTKYIERVQEPLVLAEIAERVILDVEIWRYPADPNVNQEELTKYSTILTEIYSDCDGIEMGWKKSESSEIGGRINIIPHKLFSIFDQSLIDQCDMDEDMDPNLRYFRVIDTPTMNTLCGFFELPNETGERSVHYYRQGSQFARNLDLTIDGYLEMAVECGVTYGWQQALLDIKDNKDSSLTESFTSNVQLIFPDFSLESYATKYSSLRISLKK